MRIFQLPAACRRLPAVCLAVLAAGAAAPAFAAGGAHVVDDAQILQPGSLQLELWSAFALSGGQVLNATPGLTLRTLPRVEFSLSVTTDDTNGERREAGVAGQAKFLLRPIPEDGVPIGVALAVGHGLDVRRGRSDTTYVLGIVSLAPAEGWLIHGNAGWERAHADAKDGAVWGVAAEWEPADGWTLVGELFGSSGARTGVQAGIRRTLLDDRLDLDLLAARNLQGERATFVTLGTTLRF